jgi:hypothetical protein
MSPLATSAKMKQQNRRDVLLNVIALFTIPLTRVIRSEKEHPVTLVPEQDGHTSRKQSIKARSITTTSPNRSVMRRA